MTTVSSWFGYSLEVHVCKCDRWHLLLSIVSNIAFTKCTALICLFQVEDEDPPLSSPLNLVFIIPLKRGLAMTCLSSHWAYSSLFYSFSLSFLLSLPSLDLRNPEHKLLSSSHLRNRFKCPTWTSSSTLSLSVAHSFVVWPLLRWYLQYLFMLANFEIFLASVWDMPPSRSRFSIMGTTLLVWVSFDTFFLN